MDKQDGYYKITDLHLTAYLSLRELTFTYTRDGRSLVFLFKDKAKAEKMVLEYLNGKAEVPAKKFVETLQSLKSLVFGHI